MLKDAYDVVMDEEKNPLSPLPKKTRFQIMTILSFMWSAVLTVWVGSYLVFGPTMVAHLLLLIAVFFTADIFRRSRSAPPDHREAMRDERDGAVLYDDLWGAPYRVR